MALAFILAAVSMTVWAEPAAIDGLISIVPLPGRLAESIKLGGPLSISEVPSGECRETRHGPERAAPDRDAGAITFADGQGAVLRLLPRKRAGNEIEYDVDRVRRPSWGPGEILRVKAAGGQIPAFAAALSVPAPLELTSPTELDDGLPQIVTWKPGPGEVRIRYLGFASSMVCVFPRSAGRAELPRKAPRRQHRVSEGVERLTIEPYVGTVVSAGSNHILVEVTGKATALTTRVNAPRSP